jgi:hypothetical protein
MTYFNERKMKSLSTACMHVKISSNPLFKGGRLKEFFPKFASIEYFFTGMFVENLLWTEKKIEKLEEEPKPKIADFEVEIY